MIAPLERCAYDDYKREGMRLGGLAHSTYFGLRASLATPIGRLVRIGGLERIGPGARRRRWCIHEVYILTHEP